MNDFSRYTWVLFLAHKNDVFHEFSKICRKIQNEKGFTISCIRSDHGREFENVEFESFCDEQEIEHTFSAPRTPQQNGVVERKNRTLQEPFFMKTICQIIFGPKRSTLHAIY